MAQNTDYKEARASVRIVFRTYDVQKDGSCPFFICITKQRKRKYVATGITLDPKYWDDAKKVIRKSYPPILKRELELRLKKLVEKYEIAADALANADEQHDVANVASKAVEGRKQSRRTTLLAYIDTIVESMVKARKTGNSLIYRDLRNQLAKFITDEFNAQDLTFDKITVNFCTEWENTLRATGATDNTLSNRFRTLRAVLNRAIANDFAKADSYPFARNTAEKYKFSIGKFDTSTQKRAINRDDIRRVENFIPIGIYTPEDFKDKRNAKAIANIKNTAEVERLTIAKAVFLFSFYCGGINFIDLAKLSWSNISTDAEGYLRINYIRQKTKGKFSIRLLAPVASIIEHFRALTYSEPESHIFPILDNKKHITEDQINNRLNKILGQINRDLKTLSHRVGINTPLTTYVARHSFATILRQKGTATSVISQAMGHKSEAVTAIYLDSFSSETVDLAYEALL